MIRRRFLAAAPLWFAARPALAAPADVDPRFPSAIASRIGGKAVPLVLTGSAMRKKYGFSVYAVASYVREGARVGDADALARADVAKQLHLIFERDVDVLATCIASSFRASIGMSHPAPAFAAELAKLEGYWQARGAKQGDHVWLTHVPGYGLGCQVVGQPVVVIAGVDFARGGLGDLLRPERISACFGAGRPLVAISCAGPATTRPAREADRRSLLTFIPSCGFCPLHTVDLPIRSR